MSYEKEDQIEFVIDHVFLRDHSSKIPFELDISISPISVEEICDLVTFLLVLLNLFILLASVALPSSLESCNS